MDFENFDPAALPITIAPIYSHSEPNSSIPLREGDLELDLNGVICRCQGKIELQFLPQPRTAVELTSRDRITHGVIAIPKLIIPDSPEPAQIEITGSGSQKLADKTWERFASGTVRTHIRRRSACGISFIVAAIPNFPSVGRKYVRDDTGDYYWPGRSECINDQWKITIDRLRLGRDFGQTLKSAAGYGITHVCRIEKADQTDIDVDAALDIVAALRSFLSFVRGAWTMPMLPVGFDRESNRVWELWNAPIVDPMRHVRTWHMPLDDPLPATFSGFMDKWVSEIWNEPIRLAIHWYVEANKKAGGIEGSLILLQSAFELLSWTYLVAERRILSADAFQPGKLSGADKLRLLLSGFDISLKIPESLERLTQLAPDLKWVDGPHALVDLRNAIVHAEPKKREKLSIVGDAIDEAWLLSTSYLETIILKLVKHKGSALDRIHSWTSV